MRSSLLPSVLILALAPSPGCSKSSSSSKLESYKYEVSTPKRETYPEGMRLYLGEEELGAFGPYEEKLERRTLAFERPLDAPLSGTIDTGLALQWTSPCGPVKSALTPEEGMEAGLAFLQEQEAGQKKHGDGTAWLKMKEVEPSSWTGKVTYIWTDIAAERLTLGKMEIPVKKGEPALAYALDCGDSHELAIGEVTTQIDTKALAESVDFDWDGKFQGRYLFIGQKDQCYAFSKLSYRSDNIPVAPKTTMLTGGQAHMLPNDIDDFLRDAPENLTIEVPAGSSGPATATRYELKKAECKESSADEKADCFESCRGMGGTRSECKQVCKNSK